MGCIRFHVRSYEREHVFPLAILLVQSFVRANLRRWCRYFCSARDVIFMFIVISSERPRSSYKIHFDDRQLCYCGTRSV